MDYSNNITMNRDQIDENQKSHHADMPQSSYSHSQQHIDPNTSAYGSNPMSLMSIPSRSSHQHANSSLNNVNNVKDEEGWSVRVRIVSMENFPHTFIPSQSPYCIMFRLGIISDSQNKLSNTSLLKFGSRQNKNNTCNMILASSLKFISSQSSSKGSNDNNNNNSKNVDNKNVPLIWDEEFRWDNISSRLATYLVVDIYCRGITNTNQSNTTSSNEVSNEKGNQNFFMTKEDNNRGSLYSTYHGRAVSLPEGDRVTTPKKSRRRPSLIESILRKDVDNAVSQQNNKNLHDGLGRSLHSAFDLSSRVNIASKNKIGKNNSSSNLSMNSSLGGRKPKPAESRRYSGESLVSNEDTVASQSTHNRSRNPFSFLTERVKDVVTNNNNNNSNNNNNNNSGPKTGLDGKPKAFSTSSLIGSSQHSNNSSRFSPFLSFSGRSNVSSDNNSNSVTKEETAVDRESLTESRFTPSGRIKWTDYDYGSSSNDEDEDVNNDESKTKRDKEVAGEDVTQKKEKRSSASHKQKQKQIKTKDCTFPSDILIGSVRIPLADIPIYIDDDNFADVVYVENKDFDIELDSNVGGNENEELHAAVKESIKSFLQSASFSSSTPTRSKPKVALQISVSTPEYLDDSEDEYFHEDSEDSESESDEELVDDVDTDNHEPKRPSLESVSSKSSRNKGKYGKSLQHHHHTHTETHGRRRSSVFRSRRKSYDSSSGLDLQSDSTANNQNTNQQGDESGAKRKVQQPNEPVVEPGLIDFIGVVGATNLGELAEASLANNDHNSDILTSSARSLNNSKQQPPPKRYEPTPLNDPDCDGWLPNIIPDTGVYEQFPPNDEFHRENGRNTATFFDKIEWFCFPEGCRIWSGWNPPTQKDLDQIYSLQKDESNNKNGHTRLSPNMRNNINHRYHSWDRTYQRDCRSEYNNDGKDNTSNDNVFNKSLEVFDECLHCTTSLSWFVLQSTSESYGSKSTKTYGVTVRFFVPVYSHLNYNNSHSMLPKPLWVPMGICVTTQYPIVGIVEEIILRVIQVLTLRRGNYPEFEYSRWIKDSAIHKELAFLIVNCPTPIPNVLNVSIPFLHGEKLHTKILPTSDLPTLPHGYSVLQTCRLIGAEGLVLLLSACLTECKILIHSSNTANLAMVGEVITALLFPFNWTLPYIPNLPESMIEFLESPIHFFYGVPSNSLKWVDPNVLSDIVVVDLDNGVAPGTIYQSSQGESTRNIKESNRSINTGGMPNLLPESVTHIITQEVERLLKEEKEIEDFIEESNIFIGSNKLPRLEIETLAERRLRLTVAVQICGLLRGYQEHLFFVATTKPVFNRDRFLRKAPALFEERRRSSVGSTTSHSMRKSGNNNLMSRNKRFLSLLVNTQQFHGLMESLDMEHVNFFHDVLEVIQKVECQYNFEEKIDEIGFTEECVIQLDQITQEMENSIPTYHIQRPLDVKEKEQILNDEKKESTVLTDTAIMKDRLLGSDKDYYQDAFEDLEDFERLVGNINFLDIMERSYGPKVNFTKELLQPIHSISDNDTVSESDVDNDHSPTHTSAEEKKEDTGNLWTSRKMFDIMNNDEEDTHEDEEDSILPWQLNKKVTIREAIGEHRFNNYIASTHETGMAIVSDNMDINALISSAKNDMNTTVLRKSNHGKGSSSSKTSSRKSSIDMTRADKWIDREVITKCLQVAYEGATNTEQSQVTRRTTISHIASHERFQQNGRDLIKEAEFALRNPTTQQFLLSVLNQRTRLQQQGQNQSQGQGLGRLKEQSRDSVTETDKTPFKSNKSNKSLETIGSSSTSSHHNRASAKQKSYVSRLNLAAFQCLLRLCNAMLEACMMEDEYEAAHQLLGLTYGFCTLIPFKDVSEGDMLDSSNSRVEYLTMHVFKHPIFSDFSLWESVLDKHKRDRQQQGLNGEYEENLSAFGVPTPKKSDKSTCSTGSSDASNQIAEYEAAVTTLYEMNGYGVSSEDLVKFATKFCKERSQGASTNRGMSLLEIARRLTMKRQDKGDMLDFTPKSSRTSSSKSFTDQSKYSFSRGLSGSTRSESSRITIDEEETSVVEFAWNHPFEQKQKQDLIEKDLLKNMTPPRQKSKNKTDQVVNPEGYQGKMSVTAMTSFGSSIVVTGGLDGSLFLAHTFQPPTNESRINKVSGISLKWKNNAASIIADPNGVNQNAVTCLASVYSQVGQYHSAIEPSNSEHEDFIAATEGCYVIAGSTSGALNVWSVKDVLFGFMVQSGILDTTDLDSSAFLRNNSQSTKTPITNKLSSGASSTNLRKVYASTLAKAALSGRSLDGHIGGVTCFDVPSPIYRPNTVVSGGADGVIKFWTLQSGTGGGTNVLAGSLGGSSRHLNNDRKNFGFLGKYQASGIKQSKSGAHSQNQRQGKVLARFIGHEAGISCLKSAWHGDRLMSGGADHKIKLWDLCNNNKECLQTNSSHHGNVTNAQYWGPNTVVSASTDRTVALWDPRTGNYPNFVLRHHKCPISDLLVGSRSEPQIVSAGVDSSMAIWDLRVLSGSGINPSSKKNTPMKSIRNIVERTFRNPVASMYHCADRVKGRCHDPVLLARGTNHYHPTVMSANFHGISSFDITDGKRLDWRESGHSDSLSVFSSISKHDGLHLRNSRGNKGHACLDGFITCSWDGTVRMRGS